MESDLIAFAIGVGTILTFVIMIMTAIMVPPYEIPPFKDIDYPEM